MSDVGQWLQEQWFGVASFIIGTGLAIFFYFRQLQPKTLDYEVNSSLRLLSSKTQHNWLRRLHVLFDDQEVQDPVLITMTVRNSGKRAVVAADYVEPITISFSGAAPLDAQINDASSPDLRHQQIDLGGLKDATMLEFKPALMNPGDWFEVVTLHDGEPNFHKVTARFADQSKPMKEIGVDYLGPAVHAALAAPPSPDALINRLYHVLIMRITEKRR